VSDGGPVHTDVVVITEFEELFTRELGAVVGDDGFGYPEAIDDVSEEGHDFLGANSCYWPSLDPLGELVNSHEQVREAPECLPKRSDQIQPPRSKGLRDGDGLECLRREVGLSCDLRRTDTMRTVAVVAHTVSFVAPVSNAAHIV
jgi:hypothetical protein